MSDDLAPDPAATTAGAASGPTGASEEALGGAAPGVDGTGEVVTGGSVTGRTGVGGSADPQKSTTEPSSPETSAAALGTGESLGGESLGGESLGGETGGDSAPPEGSSPDEPGATELQPEAPDGESRARKALDLLLFAPAGLVATALEDLPQMVDKGRARFELHIRNARFIGQFVVARGQNELRDRVLRTVRVNRITRPEDDDTVSDEAEPVRPGAAPARPPTVPALDKSTREARRSDDAARPPVAAPPAATQAGAIAASGELEAIPGYDTLSASQVVRRLEGLGQGELEAILRYEGTHRGRRTILHRTQQLLGIEEPPGSTDPVD